MPVEILMPELGESVHEGTVSRWLKQVGDFVKEDEPVVEIMTDKVNTELGAPASGVLVQILIPEGGDVEVFHAMGLIEPDPEAAKSAIAAAPAPAAETPKTEPKAEAPKPAEPVPVADGERRWYSPVVRSIAKTHGLSDSDLAGISGSGSGGRVTKKDLEAYLSGGGKPGPDTETHALAGMRKMIAEAMVRSAAVPTVSTLTEVDVTPMVQFRERNKESFQQQYGVKLTYTPFFIKAITDTLLEFPYLNASLVDNQVTMHRSVHIGVAVSLGEKGDGGLIVPVIRDCEKKSLIDIAKDLETIAAKARSNKLDVSAVQGGTFTLTNPGSYGATLGTPMINAPQSGILGTYGIIKRPVIVDDMIAVRSIMNLVLTYDHRLVDGLMAGRFLQALRARLEGFAFFK
jgi:pyruvate/2-oxoglutarate dehydrogenase complex dihydrolipoamide acyltransferase (E2) component